MLCLDDVERIARESLPADVWDFVSGGSGAEATLSANRAALRRIELIPRVLRDVEHCTTETTLFGDSLAMPVATAAFAYQRLVHPEGEVAAARAAKAAGVPFTVGTLSSCPVEAITEIGGTVWFQLYWLRDREKTFELVRRAEDAGCRALMLTVDVPWMGRRLRDVRNRFVLPAGVEAANLTWGSSSEAHRSPASGSAVASHTQAALAPSLTWTDVEELRSRTTLPLILKGVLAAEDARRAADMGVDAVVVSNHGGRQLDGAVASIDALAPVVAAVDGDCRVLFDSGVRHGTDVLKALALGADGVLLGRPVLWGLAAAGEQGVRRVLELVAEELLDALGLAGCGSVAEARAINTVTG
ncbi:alpha-hydroxy acid oxidase [Streptomyces sp. 150FB]|uniref:alpha-hydroxy acid oxidase n=1 Tax=Streptomyces sp. 150FB TaxID=1576605 RepID=UPI000695A905|nr:alpha-hydroxy acid oxidase [Streptomyces sp. 150FB]